MKETTLAIIKPGPVRRGTWVDILRMYEKKEFCLDRASILLMDPAMAEAFYAEHQGKTFFSGLIEHMTSGPIIAMIISGENAVARVRELNGATNPAEAAEGTIRRKYGDSNGGPDNAVHESDSQESARREIGVIFGKAAI